MTGTKLLLLWLACTLVIYLYISLGRNQANTRRAIRIATRPEITGSERI